MTSLRLAWSFLTAFPGPRQGAAEPRDFALSQAWYPLVGAVLGLSWWTVFQGAAFLHASPLLRAVAILAAMLLSTGFLHLDGLLDCGDALLLPKSPEDRLRILKDVHLGAFAFGTGALWMFAMVASLADLREPWLLVALPALSRGILLVPLRRIPYARSSGAWGTAIPLPRAVWLLPAACTLAAAWFFPREAAAVAVSQAAFAWWAARRLGGGLTGDAYGALLCVSESAALLVHALGS